MRNLHKSAVMLSPNDSTALEMAVEKVRSTVRAGELADLIRQRGWHAAAMVAAYDCQSRALRLPVWEEPPCAAGPTDKGKAGRLLRRMLARGVSRYHPDPLAAIACAASATTRAAVAAPKQSCEPSQTTAATRRKLTTDYDANGMDRPCPPNDLQGPLCQEETLRP